MTKQEFDKKYVKKKLGVHCPTEELATELLEMADNFGYMWCTEDNYVNNTDWRVYEKDTCYCIFDGEYCDLEFYQDEDYEITLFESLSTKKIF